MPIRLCQKCGLKVLIDESQAGTTPFYCQRCTTAMKGQEGAAPAPGPITPVRNLTPSPVSTASSSSTGTGGALKAATVRVLCPYCKASFNGRVPAKPARGSCPVCQKELILLPDGDIKPAAGFDIASWQSGGGGPPPAAEDVEAPKESHTQLLVKKYAADAPSIPPPPALKPVARKLDIPTPTPSPVSPSSDAESGGADALPSWLDDGSKDGGAPPAEDGPVEDIDLNDPKNDLSEAPPPPVATPRSRPLAKAPAPAHRPPPAARPVQPPPPPPPPPPPEEEVDLLPPPVPAPPRQNLGRSSGTRRAVSAPPPAPAAPSGAPTGSGKAVAAFILALLPIAAGAGLLASPDKLKHEQVKKVGERLTKGLAVLHLKLFPPPPPPKLKVEEKAPLPEPVKEEPPKADPDQQHKDELAISHLFNETLQLKRNLKQLKVAASEGQKDSIAEIQRKIDGNEARIKQQRETYRKMYGKDYDPEK